MLKDLALKLAALFSYCGGPLFVADVLKPHLPSGAPFLVTFLPVGLMVVGALSLDDDTHSRWSRGAVWAGRQGLIIVLVAHVCALWCFAEGVRVPDQGLHYFGIAVGVVWSVAYWRASRRWLRSAADAAAADPASTEPIEPS